MVTYYTSNVAFMNELQQLVRNGNIRYYKGNNTYCVTKKGSKISYLPKCRFAVVFGEKKKTYPEAERVFSSI